jgi:hypothetical protein
MRPWVPWLVLVLALLAWGVALWLGLGGSLGRSVYATQDWTHR